MILNAKTFRGFPVYLNADRIMSIKHNGFNQVVAQFVGGGVMALQMTDELREYMNWRIANETDSRTV